MESVWNWAQLTVYVSPRGGLHPGELLSLGSSGQGETS